MRHCFFFFFFNNKLQECNKKCTVIILFYFMYSRESIVSAPRSFHHLAGRERQAKNHHISDNKLQKTKEIKKFACEKNNKNKEKWLML